MDKTGATAWIFANRFMLTKQHHRLFAVVAFLAMIFATDCRHKPLSDDRLAHIWLSNENWFEQISSAYVAGKVDCSNERDPDICLGTGSEAAISNLRRNAGIQSVYVKRNRGDDNGVWLPVETYGVLSTSSSTRGYVYLGQPPRPRMTVDDTLAADSKGTKLKPIKDHWFIFVVN